MHISIVSLSTERVSFAEWVCAIDGVMVHELKTLDNWSDKNILIDIVFFDVQIGIESILKQVYLYQHQNKKMKWIVIHLENVHLSLQFIKAGASGVLTTFCEKEVLLNSIQTVSENKLFLPDDLIQALALRQLKKILHPFVQLTAREFDVFCLLAENYSIQTIAEELSITPKTVFNCQTQLRQKLSLKNQQQIELLAKNNGLIS